MSFPGSSLQARREPFIALNQNYVNIAHNHISEVTAIAFGANEFLGRGAVTPKLNLGWRLRFLKLALNGPTDIMFELDGFIIPSPLTINLSQGTRPSSIKQQEKAFPPVRVTEDIMKSSRVKSYNRPNCHIATSELSIQSYPYFTLTVTWSDDIKKAGLPKSIDAQSLFMDYMFESMSENPVYIDIKFWVFSTKAADMVMKPKAVFANSKALMARCEYFNDLFSNTAFAENNITALDDIFPTNREPFRDKYDYDCDSDFDEEHEKPNLSSKVTRMFEDFKERVESGSIRFHGLQGKIVFIQDAAFKTFQALVYYLSTDYVAFAPLSSSGRQSRAAFIETYMQENPKRPMPCSAKSMYKLADKLCLQTLKEQCLEHISNELSVSNITEEIFSDFTSWFEDVMNIEVKYFSEHYDEVVELASYEGRLAEMMATASNSTHVAKVLSTVMKSVARRENRGRKFSAVFDSPSSSPSPKRRRRSNFEVNPPQTLVHLRGAQH